MPKTYSSVWVHLIWTTKDRNPLLHKDFRVELCASIKENAAEYGYFIDMINGIEDHMHCLIRLLPPQSISEVMKQIKGFSSHWINESGKLKVKFNWQQGFGALSVSPGEIDEIRNYIINQEHHHKEWRLDDELQRFQYYNPD